MHTHRAAFIASLLGLALAAPACITLGSSSYSGHGMKFDYPDGTSEYKLKERVANEDRAWSVAISGSWGGDSLIVIEGFEQDRGGATSLTEAQYQDLVNQIRKNARDSGGDPNAVSPRQVDGRQGVVFEASAKSYSGADTKQHVAFVVDMAANRNLRITCQYTEEKRDDVLKACESLLAAIDLDAK
ncbi:MAG: hypothetical protein U0547_03080 [Dehalococcoidia bacterium]